jgi:hypothetical protein
MQQEKFSHKGDAGLLSNSWGSLRLVPYLRSSSKLQQQAICNSKQTVLYPQLTMVVVSHQQIARLTKPKE